MKTLILLPIFIATYFIIGIFYNLIKKPKEWKKLFKWIYTGDVYATWIGITYILLDSLCYFLLFITFLGYA